MAMEFSGSSVDFGFPQYDDYESIGQYLRDCRHFYSDQIRAHNKKVTQENRSRGNKPSSFSRKRNIYSQLEVGLACGFDGPQHISNVERGTVLPSLSLAVKLMELYKIERIAMYVLFMKYREREYSKVFLENTGKKA